MCGGARLRPMGVGVEGVEEEVQKLFPEARASGLDLAELARRIARRKTELERKTKAGSSNGTAPSSE